MKNLVLMFCAFALLTVASCSKEDDPNNPNNSNNQPNCEKYNYGFITVSNNSTNPYDIYINGIYETRVSGKNIVQDREVQQGNNIELYAKQVSGYILYPTTKTAYVNVIECSSYSWQIP